MADALIGYVREISNFWRVAKKPAHGASASCRGNVPAWTDWRADDDGDRAFVRGDALLFLDEGTLLGAGGRALCALTRCRGGAQMS